MKHKIYDLTDKAKDEGFATPEDYHRGMVSKWKAENKLFAWGGHETSGSPVYAIVDRGRWLAKCECGAYDWVAPDHKFWCFVCGNIATKGRARPVVFPEDKAEIEAELLRRDIIVGAGKSDVQKLLTSKPAIPHLARNWKWGEKVQDLIDQREGN